MTSWRLILIANSATVVPFMVWSPTSLPSVADNRHIFGDRLAFSRQLISDQSVTISEQSATVKKKLATDCRLVADWMGAVLSPWFKNNVFVKYKTISVQVAIMIIH